MAEEDLDSLRLAALASLKPAAKPLAAEDDDELEVLRKAALLTKKSEDVSKKEEQPQVTKKKGPERFNRFDSDNEEESEEEIESPDSYSSTSSDTEEEAKDSTKSGGVQPEHIDSHADDQKNPAQLAPGDASADHSSDAKKADKKSKKHQKRKKRKHKKEDKVVERRKLKFSQPVETGSKTISLRKKHKKKRSESPSHRSPTRQDSRTSHDKHSGRPSVYERLGNKVTSPPRAPLKSQVSYAAARRVRMPLDRHLVSHDLWGGAKEIEIEEIRAKNIKIEKRFKEIEKDKELFGS